MRNFGCCIWNFLVFSITQLLFRPFQALSLYIYLSMDLPINSLLSPLHNLNLVHTIVDASWVLPPCRVSIRAGIQVPSAKPSSGSTRGVAGAWILAHRYLGRSTHDGACPDICAAVTFVRLQHLSCKSHCARAYYEGATTLAHRLEFQLFSAQNF
jgi:hypothetical protein